MGVPAADKVRTFVSSRPPLVLFVCCIGFCALALLTIANYIQLGQLRSPASKDWNTFLESFSKLDFCIMTNTSISPIEMTTIVPYHNASTDLSSVYSVSMLLTLHPTREFISASRSNYTRITGAIYGRQLGLEGVSAGEMINVTMDVPLDTGNKTRCSTPYHCDQVQIYTCVYFQASSSVFPSSRSPDVCESVNETMVESVAYMSSSQQMLSAAPAYTCRRRPLITVHYKLNPTLTLWLTLRDRSVINLHLLHTSYFLFVMVMTVIIYASIRSYYSKPKLTQADKVELYMET